MQKLVGLLVLAAACSRASAVRGRTLRASVSMKQKACAHINNWATQHLPDKQANSLQNFVGDLDATQAALLDKFIIAHEQRNSTLNADHSKQILAIIDNMLQDTETTHDTAQKYVDNLHADFASCDSTGSAQDTVISGYQNTYNSETSTHSQLRHEEEAALTAKTNCLSTKKQSEEAVDAKQALVDDARETPSCAQCTPKSQSPADVDEWFADQKACFENGAATLARVKTELETAQRHLAQQDCSSLEVDYANKKAAADAALQTVESSSCSAAVSQRTKCTSYSACYEGKVETYNNAKQEVSQGENDRKVQWRGASRIKCIIQAMETNTVDEIQKCLDKTLVDSHLDLTIQDAPAASTCDEPTDYPCVGIYTTKVYPSQYQHLSMPPCNACDLTGAATTTIPTTTTTTTTIAATTTTKAKVDCSSMGGTDCSGSLQSWAGVNTCVAHVSTSGSNCVNYCSARGFSCVKAMDNLGTCGLNEAEHNRQTTDQNGCLQNWGDQICACGQA